MFPSYQPVLKLHVRKYFFYFCLVLVLIPSLLTAKDKVISFKKEQINIPNTGYSIANVINVTSDDHYIGFALTSANYQKTPVRFEKSIETEFKSLLPLSPAGDTSRKILIRINWIFVYEVQLEEQKLTTTELNLSFIEKHDNHFTELYRGAVSVSEKRNQKLNIIQAIENCFQGFARRVSENKLCSVQLPIKSLMVNPLSNMNMNQFMKLERNRKGIYWTYDDFYYNTPDTTSLFSIRYKDKFDKQDSLIIKHAKAYYIGNTTKSLDAWGFADSSRVFIKEGDLFYLLNPYEDGYYLKFKAHDNTGFYAGAAVGGMMFGLIGGLFVGTVFGLIPGVNSSEQLLHFDLRSGSFDIFFKKEMKTIESRLIFYSPAENNQAFKLYFKDQFQCDLPPGSWVKFTFPASVKKIDVTLKLPDGSLYSDEINPKLFYTDIYICHERVKKPPFFRKVSYNTTASTLEKLVDENEIK